MQKLISKYFIYQWIKSWVRLLPLNWPYFRARILGYKYYIEVGISIDPRFSFVSMENRPSNIQQIKKEMNDIGSKVLMVRRVKRRNYRSMRWQLFAVFKDTESAFLFKLREGGGQLKKFDSWF